MNARHRQIELHDGRRLGYACYGDPDGRPMLYFHGLPSSRLEAGFCAAAAQRLGIRVIAVDRPGYGRSDFQPQRRIPDWPDDVAELADALELERFVVLGVSGGGPYALACAWKLADRIDVVKLVGGLAPLHRPETLGAMRFNARLAFTLARRAPALLKLSYGNAVTATMRHWPQLAAAWLHVSGCRADRAGLAAPGATARMVAALREGLRQGPAGALWDLELYAWPWGFSLEDIGVEVELWQGTADRIVPPFHARALATALPHPLLKLVTDAGHYSLPICQGEVILANLAGQNTFG